MLNIKPSKDKLEFVTPEQTPKCLFCSHSSPPIVLENTSNVHTAGTKTHTDQALSPPAAHGTEHLETNTSHGLEEQVRLSDNT